MKVYLICAPVWTKDRIPLGLATLQAYLKEAGHSIRIFDLSNELYRTSRLRSMAMDISESYSYINREFSCSSFFLGKMKDYFSNIEAADAYCFSIYRTNIRNSLLIAESIKKKNSKAKVIFGGPYTYFSFARRTIERSGVVDHIISGEGELDLLAYLRYLRHDKIPRKHMIIEDLEKELLPDFSGFNPKNYVLELPYSTSRGCHNSCTYCFDKAYWSGYRFKSAEKILGDLKSLIKEYGINDFLFSDSTCFGTKENLMNFCKSVTQENLKIFWGSQTRYFDLTDEELKLLRKAGCSWLSIGIENCSEKVRRHMRKGYSLGQIEKFIRRAPKHGIKVSTCYMVGYPTETWNDYLITLRFILKNRKHVNYAAASTTSIYEGTYLYENSDKLGIRKKDSFFWASSRSNAYNRIIKYLIMNLICFFFVKKGKDWLKDIRS